MAIPRWTAARLRLHRSNLKIVGYKAKRKTGRVRICSCKHRHTTLISNAQYSVFLINRVSLDLKCNLKLRGSMILLLRIRPSSSRCNSWIKLFFLKSFTVRQKFLKSSPWSTEHTEDSNSCLHYLKSLNSLISSWWKTTVMSHDAYDII